MFKDTLDQPEKGSALIQQLLDKKKACDDEIKSLNKAVKEEPKLRHGKKPGMAPDNSTMKNVKKAWEESGAAGVRVEPL